MWKTKSRMDRQLDSCEGNSKLQIFGLYQIKVMEYRPIWQCMIFERREELRKFSLMRKLSDVNQFLRFWFISWRKIFVKTLGMEIWHIILEEVFSISFSRKVAYHLFKINEWSSKPGEIVKLCRKAKWNSHNHYFTDNNVAGLDINPCGETLATIDRHGICLISDANTNGYKFHLSLQRPTSDRNLI